MATGIAGNAGFVVCVYGAYCRAALVVKTARGVMAARHAMMVRHTMMAVMA
jgi:hypothetical protein